jgi:hypothetical protein
MNKTAHCTCTHPVVVMKAAHKGAATSFCARCHLPIRLTLA